MRNTVIRMAILVLLFCCAVFAADAAEVRTWKSKSGTNIEAAFVQVKGGLVFLETADGKSRKIPVVALTAEDQEYVRSMAPTDTAGTSEPPAGRASAKRNAAAADVSGEIKALLGPKLVDRKGHEVAMDVLGGKIVGLYFSASWCGPCRNFTPKLIDAYKELQDQGKAFEVVLVPLDRDDASMEAYMDKYDMPWTAVPVSGGQAGKIAGKFGVRGIPMLIVVDEQGNLLSKSGTGEVSQQGAGAFDAWRK